MNRNDEYEVKLDRVLRFLSHNDLDGVVLSKTANFAWLGCGANSVINSAEETGIGTFIVTPDRVTLVSKNIETERLLTEELSGLSSIDSITYPWHKPDEREKKIAKLCASGTFVADDGTCDLPTIPAGWKRLRYELTDAEIQRYRHLGQDTSEAMESAARDVQQGITEREIAGLIAEEYRSRGFLPAVLLVAVDERIRQWRHPLPKTKKLERYAMLAACGRRKGLVTAITRFVHFGTMPEDLKRRHQAVCEVDARIIEATKFGATAGDIFQIAQESYAKVGFSDEWTLHHQGGAIGYNPREYIADPACQETVVLNQAFAWNPSICGTKSEDTILITDQGPEFITHPSPQWPTVEVETHGRTFQRADMLVR